MIYDTLFLLPVAAVEFTPWEISPLTPAGLTTFLLALRELESSQLLGCGGEGAASGPTSPSGPAPEPVCFRVHGSLLKIRRKRMNF